jgi:hypothetical protein
MKNILPHFIFIFIFSVGVNAQQTKKVLFIGNSYTGVNNLPGMVSSIATSFGDILIYDSNTPGGYTFYAHSTNATTITKINSNNWDYVVLQEQSQLPSFSPAQVANDVYPYADSLNRIIQENDSCTHTMFYMTWGRKNGDASNCASYTPVCTYNGMQARLRASYIEMANDLDAEVSPVGAVWKKFRTDFPTVELYNADESHPSIHGTYLAACTFYASIYHQSPIGAFIPSGISAQEASDIQNIVNDIVFDSLTIWRIDTAEISANFSKVNLSGNTFSFDALDVSGDEYHWDFGDGNTSTTFNSNSVQHTYSTNGNYSVSLIVLRKCESDTMTQNVSGVSLGLENLSENHFRFFPNPTDENIFIQSDLNGKISILDWSGREVYSGLIPQGKTMFDLSFLLNGNYFIQFLSDEKSQIKKLTILK